MEGEERAEEWRHEEERMQRKIPEHDRTNFPSLEPLLLGCQQRQLPDHQA